MTRSLKGLHHVTAVAGDPQRNLDFYAGTLGLRLVKQTVNFDDPGTYHLYYGDDSGAPGSILTFFPWVGARRGTRGTGEVQTTALSVPPSSLDYWLERLREQKVAAERVREGPFEDQAVRLVDPDGMGLELVEAAEAPGPHAIGGLHGVTAVVRDARRTAELLTGQLGYRLEAEEKERFRFVAGEEGAAGRRIDLLVLTREMPGRPGAGSVHHIAFRVADESAQLAWRERLLELGYQVSPVMDRDYFRSIYFREAGGILFEIATDGPGFAVDESLERLGQSLKLPRWIEPQRERIMAALPPLHLPAG